MSVCVELPNELMIDVATSIDAEAQFNLPPHQSELNIAVLGNVPDHLGFNARCLVKSGIKWNI
jgi:hypothetical protein